MTEHLGPDGSRSLLEATRILCGKEPMLAPLISLDFDTLSNDAELLAAVLAGAIPAGSTRTAVRTAAAAVLGSDRDVLRLAIADVRTATRRNFEPGGEAATLLFARGVHALLAHRIAHAYWREGRFDLSLGLKTVFSRAFSTDIHPGAHFAAGVWLDHGLGFVAGETAVVEDGVSIWHGVTLGSTLKDAGSTRHPRLCSGSTIGAGATILGGIVIGRDSVVAAGAVVLRDVAPGETVAGVPARSKPRSTSSFSGFARPNADESLR